MPKWAVIGSAPDPSFLKSKIFHLQKSRFQSKSFDRFETCLLVSILLKIVEEVFLQSADMIEGLDCDWKQARNFRVDI